MIKNCNFRKITKQLHFPTSKHYLATITTNMCPHDHLQILNVCLQQIKTEK